MNVTILTGDCREVLPTLPEESVQCCVTSPPYFGLRDYGHAGQIGLEASPAEFIATMVEVFREVRRVLRKDGTLWLNLGSSYAAHEGQRKPTDKAGLKQQSCRGSTAVGSRSASGDTSANQSRRSSRAPACGTDDKELLDLPGIDSSCFDLCDGCQAALPKGNGHIFRPLEQSKQPRETIARYHGHSGCETIAADASLPCVPESTIPESSPRLREDCRHCANCGACLSVLRSSSRDSRLCVRKASCIGDTLPRVSEFRSQDREALGLAWTYSSMASLNFKPKDLIPIPWLVALALQADGWYLRSDIIWAKPNPMPESVTDRPTKAHEYLFLLTKSESYYYDAEAIAERSLWADDIRNGSGRLTYDGKRQGRNGEGQEAFVSISDTRNKRTVWTVPSAPYAEAHFATYPPALITPCILAGSRAGDTILDPFGGSGTTGMVATELGRKAILIELNPAYVELIENRTNVTPGLAL